MAVAWCLLALAAAAGAKPKASKKALDKMQARCTTCKAITTKFYEGHKNTDSIHFHGESKGWTKDNEKFLGKFKMGEARLVEILEQVCGARDEKCFEMLADAEEPIEEWWAERDDEGHQFDQLERHLCQDTLKVCCTAGSYGKECQRCPGRSGGVCSGHGSCDGDGVRAGTGKCKCEHGWKGKACSACKKAFYRGQSATEPPVDTCQACAAACDGCSGPGPGGCSSCREGYEMSALPSDAAASDTAPTDAAADAAGCVDLDECAAGAPCAEKSVQAVADGKPGLFCENTPGSFACASCSAACAAPADDGRWCSAAGPLGCLGGCADGYAVVSGGGPGCEDVDECAAGHACAAGEYCSNTPGSVECIACDKMCSDEGCTAGGAAGCKACKKGYEKLKGRCVDVDECKAFPCPGAEDCRNTDGGHECKCHSSNAVGDAGCERPERLRELVPFGANVTSRGTGGSKSGVAEVGGSDTNVKAYNVVLPDGLFDAAPVVTALAAKEVCCGDEIQLTTVDVAPSGFTIVVARTDAQSGWGQKLEIEWTVHAGLAAEDAAPAAEPAESPGAAAAAKDEL